MIVQVVVVDDNATQAVRLHCVEQVAVALPHLHNNMSMVVQGQLLQEVPVFSPHLQ